MKFKSFLLAAWSLISLVESSPTNAIKGAIKIYNGPGVSSPLVDEAINLFSELLSSRYSVHKVYPEELAKSNWISETALLIIPGGQATPYSKSLEGRANDNIIKYVKNGGNFMGICAGAYYASRVTQFMVNTPYEKVVERNLRFFDGISKGVTFPGYKPNSEDGAHAAKIAFQPPGEVNKFHTSVYYNGGGAFLNAANYPGVEILAKYDGIPESENVAAIFVPFSKGKVVLSHVHPEYIPDKYGKPLYDQLHDQRDGIVKLLNGWFHKLDLKLKSHDNQLQSKFQSQPQSKFISRSWEPARSTMTNQQSYSFSPTTNRHLPPTSPPFHRKRTRSAHSRPPLPGTHPDPPGPVRFSGSPLTVSPSPIKFPIHHFGLELLRPSTIHHRSKS